MFYAAAVFCFCIFLMVKLHKKQELLKKYEFENRTNGGTVEFTSYEASKKHQNSKGRLVLLNILCLIPMFISLIVFVVFLNSK